MLNDLINTYNNDSDNASSVVELSYAPEQKTLAMLKVQTVLLGADPALDSLEKKLSEALADFILSRPDKATLINKIREADISVTDGAAGILSQKGVLKG